MDDWTAWASCRGETHLFFAPLGERRQARVRREALARAVCEGCPALLACRWEARANAEHGFWGGESEHERAAAGYPPSSLGPQRRRPVIA